LTIQHSLPLALANGLVQQAGALAKSIKPQQKSINLQIISRYY